MSQILKQRFSKIQNPNEQIQKGLAEKKYQNMLIFSL